MSKRTRYPFVTNYGHEIMINANDIDHVFDNTFVQCRRVELQNEYNPEETAIALMITLTTGQQVLFCKDFEEREAIIEGLYHQGICTKFI